MAVPKTLDTGPKRLNEGKHMQSWVHVSETLCAVTTRTWSTCEWKGFTGGVLVALTDKDGGLLFQTPLVTYGVDGTWIPVRGPTDRTWPTGQSQRTSMTRQTGSTPSSAGTARTGSCLT